MTVKLNNPQMERKRLARFRDHDYKQAGYYFLTICVHHKESLLGEVKDGKIIPNVYSSIVQNTWNELPKHYENVELDEFIIMPDHIHAIIQLKDPDVEMGLQLSPEVCNGASYLEIGLPLSSEICNGAPIKPISTTNDPIKQYSLAEVVRGFKTFSAIRIHRARGTKGLSVWQKNYFERIVRNEKELNNIRQYISSNPQRYMLKRSLKEAH